MEGENSEQYSWYEKPGDEYSGEENSGYESFGDELRAESSGDKYYIDEVFDYEASGDNSPNHNITYFRRKSGFEDATVCRLADKIFHIMEDEEIFGAV